MLLANILLLGFICRRLRRWVAVMAGVGFGLFIDELGKFITSDNDYFFEPTIAIIYVIFVVLFLFARTLDRRAPLSDVERLANAVPTVRDTYIGQSTPSDVRAGLATLERQDRSDPLIAAMYDRLASVCSASPVTAGRSRTGRGTRTAGCLNGSSCSGSSSACLPWTRFSPSSESW
jgi:hypothetical protein